MSNMAGVPVTKSYEPGGAMAWLVWALAVTFVVYYFSFQTGYAIVNPSVQKDVGLSVSQVASVAALYTWVFAVCQFLSGALLDRLGAGTIIPASIALVTVGIFVFANAESYQVLLLSQLIIAVGACSGFVGAGYIGGQWFGFAKFSFMFGLVQFAASFFSAFNQNLLNVALGRIFWRDLFNYVGFFGVALFVLGAIFIRNPAPLPKRASAGPTAFLSTLAEGIVEVAKVPHVWMASAFGALCFGTCLRSEWCGHLNCWPCAGSMPRPQIGRPLCCGWDWRRAASRFPGGPTWPRLASCRLL
jgi:MFS family permease